jgi:hypothetical protein
MNKSLPMNSYKKHLTLILGLSFLGLNVLFGQKGKDGAASYTSSGSTVILNRYALLSFPTTVGDNFINVNDITLLSGNTSSQFRKSLCYSRFRSG